MLCTGIGARSDKALECFEKSLATARELKNLKGEEISLSSVGLVYEDWGQYDKAEDY